MNRGETLALSSQGKDAWNSWANNMLSQRKALEGDGTWVVERNLLGNLEPKNEATRLWLEAATADFSTRMAPHTLDAVINFSGWIFPGKAKFDRATFSSEVWFSGITFPDVAQFWDAKFLDKAWFDRTTFSGEAGFGGATFEADANFGQATFSGYAHFGKATFNGWTNYEKAIFNRDVGFGAIRSERAFSLADATIQGVPDFIQAHFAEAPGLDNLRFRSGHGRQENASARWRALKRLAIQGHDHEREQDFFAGEIKSQRFVTDWPVTWRFWSRVAWAGMARWWFGWAYQIVSGFGRSLARPFVFWVATITLGTLYFLGQSPEVASRRAESVFAYLTTSAEAWSGNQPCVSRDILARDGKTVLVSGLAEPVRSRTSAATEAMHLALRNGFIFLDGGADTAHRTFGCLYGVERYGDNPVAIVPSNVSFASALQKAFSAVLIFLFGLAVRNMLRMK